MGIGFELVEQFKENEKIYCLENENGLDALNKISQTLGYTEEGYHRGSAFENFIRDNPGCAEAIFEWIANQVDKSKDWQDALYLEPEEDDDPDIKETENQGT